MAKQPEKEDVRYSHFICTACGDIVIISETSQDRHAENCRHDTVWTHEKRLRALANTSNKKEHWDELRNHINAESMKR